jgi:hypothetical protein
MNKYEQIEQETIQTAIENLQKTALIKATWKKGANEKLDGELDIVVGGKPLHFLLEVKGELRNHNLLKILKQANQWKNLMIVANRIWPGVKEELRAKQIAYLEGNGNIFIDKKPIFIWLDHNKPLPQQRDKPNRAFARAGLQVIFLFLTDPNFLNRPYRLIAKAANTALGNINNVINGLLDLGFLIRKNKNELMFADKKGLLNKWIVAYEERLKPTLHVGNYRFLDKATDWKNFDLKTGEPVWGGEPGGDILTHYLRPEILTLYTREPQRNLMQQFRMVPDKLGTIKIYQKFWNDIEVPKPQVAPPLLVYADLINTNDKRCRETAQKIYEQYIEPDL